MDIHLIGVPMNYGCDRPGVELGPDELRKFNMIEVIESSGHNVCDLGNLSIPSIPPEQKYLDHKKMKYLSAVTQVNKDLAEKVYSALDANAFPFIVGGDHSLGLGSLAGSSKYFNEVAVIWIDAHGDINTDKTSPSGNIHGMPLAASMGYGSPYLTDLYYNGQKVKPENVFILGARDLDQGELELAHNLNLNLYTMDIIKERGFQDIINEIINKIHNSSVEGVHLSFDIDVLDSNLVPGTGTKVEDGFNVEESKFLLESFLKEGFVKSMDFVELNPKLDIDNQTVKLCIDLIEHVFSVVKDRKKALY